MEQIKQSYLENKIEVYEAMIAALTQSMFLLDRDKNIIGIFNAAPETLAGVAIDDIIGNNIMVYANDPSSPFHQACSMLNDTFDPVFNTGKSLKFQFMILDSYLETTITKISGDRILSQVRDISDIVIKQQEIERQKRDELAMAMTAGGLSSWSYNVKTDIISSQHSNNVIGSNMTLSDLLNAIEPEYRQKTVDMFDNVISRSQMHSHLTVRVRNRTGMLQWYDVHAIPYEYAPDGSVSIVAGSQKDITTEYEHNRQLRRLVMQNELILNNTSSGFVYLTPDMKVEWENVSRIFSDSEITCLVKKGKLCDIECGRQNKCCRNITLKCIETKEICKGKFQTSAQLVVEIIAQPLFDNKDNIEGIVLRLDDITEKEQAMCSLAKAKEHAEQSDKLKSAFLANMSHEIRTPLNSIVGFAQLIPQAENKEEQQQYVDIVNSNSEVLLNLINDILDLSKIEAGYFNRNDSVFNLSELFSEVETTFMYKMNSGVELLCEVPQSELYIRMDRIRISQLITNFLTNAVKFTKNGYIKIGYRIVQNKVNIFVEDTGIGMTPEEVKRVFNRFEKFNMFKQRTGLGTAIAKAIVEAYNGEIGVESTIDKGSTFWAILPIDINDDDGVEIIKQHTQTARGSQISDSSLMSILVAEDNDSNYRLIKALLKEYKVVRAQNGEEAVKMAISEPFDIILMDMRMPIMNGIEATEEIRKQNMLIPIIFVTANAFNEDHASALNAGANDFIAKPLSKQKLLEVIAKYI